ncbi:hypothetical protein ARMA_1268 [Ardenticatena maritima]|uniref:Uncharacterized protein n=1 Tax=Ardenticatena maritima TaxID=872965 RepID=A0A0M8K6L7_9CHLR|nr:hypothetical protein ARMA_1268 [Ardenticatena maritima]
MCAVIGGVIPCFVSIPLRGLGLFRRSDVVSMVKEMQEFQSPCGD